MPDVTGYYSTASVPTTTVPVQPAPQTVTPAQPTPVQGTATTPYYNGQAPASTSDTWVPTSFSDPYIAGIRTSGSAMAAMRGAKTVATMSRWNSLLAARSVAARGANSAARAAGRSVGTMAKMTKQMANAKSVADKSVLVKDVKVGVGESFGRSFLSLGNIFRSIGSSALVAIPMSLLTNFLDWKSGKISTDQRNALFVADAVGYTATGAGSSLIGGMIGSTFLGPGVGTIVGIAAGFGLGWVYEKFIRPSWGEMVHSAMYAQPTAPTVAPTPVPAQPTPAPMIVK
jgi:hypothetical protein